MSSFGGATKARGVSRAYTSLHLIGGIDIDASTRCDQIKPQRLPDLKTEGGAVFGGSVAILGDMCLNGTMYGNVGGNLSGNLMGDISVEGDLDVGGNLSAMDGMISNLVSDIVCITGELFVDVISPKTGNIIDLGNVLIDDLYITGTIYGANITGNLSNIESLTLQTLTSNLITGNLITGNLITSDVIVGNTICINDELLVDTINPKTGDTIQVGNISVNDITVNGMLLGNINIDLGNVAELALESVTANLVDANIVCVQDELQVNYITTKTGSTIQVAANLEPAANVMYNFGSPTARWNNIYGNTVYTTFLDGLSPITAKTDFIPSEDLQWNLGMVAQRWNTLCVGNIDNNGSLNGNLLSGNNIVVQQNVVADILIGNVVIVDIVNGSGSGSGVIIEGVLALDSSLTANVLSANIGCFEKTQIESLFPKSPSLDVLLYGNLIPGALQNIYLGNSTNKIEKLYVNDVIVCGTLSGNVMMGSANIGNNIIVDTITANIGCFEEAQIGSLLPKSPSQDVLLYGNVIPGALQNIYLGNSTNKIEKLYVNDIIVCGTLTGNVIANIGDDIVVNTVTANLVCVNDELLVDTINEKILNSGVTVDGVVHKDATVDANIVTSNIIEAKLSFDYKRTVVNTASYMITQSDDIIAVKYTANGIVTLTLPEISTLIRKRKRYAIVDEAGFAGTNAIIIMTSGSDKIFAGSSWMLGGDFNAVQIYSDEVDNWFAI